MKLDNLYDLQTELKLDQVSPATKLLEKRRKMYEVNEAFEIQKSDFKKQEALFYKQEEAIRDRDFNIQKDLIRFCRFLQENEAKKLRVRLKRRRTSATRRRRRPRRSSRNRLTK